MKYTVEDIMKMMAAGQTPEQIAQEFTDSLNAAISKSKEDTVKKERVAAVQSIGDQILAFVQKYYPDMYNESLRKQFDAAALDKVIEDAYNEVKSEHSVMEKFFAGSFKSKPTTCTKTIRDSDDAIKSFLKRYGLE